MKKCHKPGIASCPPPPHPFTAMPKQIHFSCGPLASPVKAIPFLSTKVNVLMTLHTDKIPFRCRVHRRLLGENLEVLNHLQPSQSNYCTKGKQQPYSYMHINGQSNQISFGENGAKTSTKSHFVGSFQVQTTTFFTIPTHFYVPLVIFIKNI